MNRKLSIDCPSGIIAVLTVVVTAACGSAPTSVCAAEEASISFEKRIVPLLVKRCLGCHNPSDPHGEFDLSSKSSAFKGGESEEPAISAGKPEASHLIERVKAGEMPPKDKGTPLTNAEIALLEGWIKSGAAWPQQRVLSPFEFTSDRRGGYDWWSLQPVTVPEPPNVKQADWPRTDFDHFVLARLEDSGLRPSVEADRRTLIRRLSFDLLGLPPAPEDIEKFVADKDPKAYEHLVDGLLASPHYGERWARHWLDVARFGESDGFEYDRPRPNAWPYRDWVINALNDDMPYDEFARRQLAGDVLRPDDGSATVATGFLIGGAFDGLKPSGDKMRKIMRQDELDELVGVASQTFIGLTVNCARCHDHKFDPVRQTDYYRIASALSGVHRGDRNVKVGGDLAKINDEINQLSQQLTAIEKPVRTAILAEKQKSAPKQDVPKPLAQWTFDGDLRDQIGGMHGSAHGSAKVEGGRLLLNGGQAYVSTAPLARDLREKTLSVWLTLNNLGQRGGGAISVQNTDGGTFDAIVYGEREPGQWMPGSNGFVRTKSFNAPQEKKAQQKTVHISIVYSADGTIAGYRNGQPYGVAYKSNGIATFASGRAQVLFGLRHGTGPGNNRMLAAAIDRAELFDRALNADEVAASAGIPVVTEAEVLARLTPEQQEQRSATQARIAALQSQVNRIKVSKVYAVTPRGAPVVHLLKRGSPFQKGEVVTPAGIPAVKGLSDDFGLEPSAPEANRRKKLAEWMTSKHNPLFARTIVNRLWHYHFGAGLVETPNDLGFSGGKPSHPRVLDTLSAKLVAEGWSLKQLHRTILLSATFRQASKFRPEAAKVDAGNRLLWRKSPMRLEAEVVRDAVLSVAGKLNPTMGGRGYEDFSKINEKSTWRYDPVDRVGPEFNRRSIYRTWARGGRNPLLDTFDCPDPSTTSPKRGVTTTPLQALVLLNNSFMLRMSDHFGERLVREAGDDVNDQVRGAYELAFGRSANSAEIERARPFVAKHGLAALCRVIFNANEFLYVE
jgi:hypothetical protein